MIEQMGFKDAAAFQNQFMCAGGIQGYKRGSQAFQSVLPKVLECALQESCISPPLSSKANHRYDQSAFSLVISSLGFTYATPCVLHFVHCSHILVTSARDRLLACSHTPKTVLCIVARQTGGFGIIRGSYLSPKTLQCKMKSY
jgi:hypothetical protein